jgi:hypothetical protein
MGTWRRTASSRFTTFPEASPYCSTVAPMSLTAWVEAGGDTAAARFARWLWLLGGVMPVTFTRSFMFFFVFITGYLVYSFD